MLIDLERYFTRKGWYDGTHTFLDIKLEGGFEAFSGHATETWEYHWIVTVIENKELEIPRIVVNGGAYETLDQVCARVLKQLTKIKEK